MSNIEWLPGLPIELITAAYSVAPGNEIESGKMASPESSSSLVANSFGYFLGKPTELPPLPFSGSLGWPAEFFNLEGIVRFPWSGGRHPCLDVLIVTEFALIGVESKRYEPFRSHGKPVLSDAYFRSVWGDDMQPYEQLRDGIISGDVRFERLDAVQLIKHAFGLRTSVQNGNPHQGKRPILYYLYAEPKVWPDGRPISSSVHAQHLEEIEDFRRRTLDAEVAFRFCSYRQLLASWTSLDDTILRQHAAAVSRAYHL